MSRYVDLDKIPFVVGFDAETDEEIRLVTKKQLDEMPTADVVEVVRCKDCAYCRYVDGEDIYKCDRRGYYSEEVKPTDYCSYGERREE